MKQVTESIFSGATTIIPMAEVQYFELDQRPNFTDGINIILSGTTWNAEADCFNNSPYLRGDEADSFRRSWRRYRAELEADTLMDIEPSEVIPGTLEGLNKIRI